MQALIDNLPTYAADLRLNYEALVVRSGVLSEAERWGTLVASAMVAGSPRLLAAVLASSPVETEGPKRAAAMMSLTNGFYRFAGRLGVERSGLRLGSLRAQTPEFHLWCLVVSARNGCEACVRSHAAGLDEEHIAAGLRLGALIEALAVVVEAEAGLR